MLSQRRASCFDDPRSVRRELERLPDGGDVVNDSDAHATHVEEIEPWWPAT